MGRRRKAKNKAYGPKGTVPRIVHVPPKEPPRLAIAHVPVDKIGSSKGGDYSSLVRSMLGGSALANLTYKDARRIKDQVGEIVDDEISSKMRTYKHCNKDSCNSSISNRCTTPVNNDCGGATSPGLQQGLWFGGGGGGNCPYAQAQKMASGSNPSAFDMSAFIRKDSIPCWGCSPK